MDQIFKTFSTEIQSVPDARQIKFIISTGSVDRDGDTIDPKGWNLEHYKKSPVVLWSHDYSQMPIARAIAIGPTDKGLEATTEFPAKGVYPFADQVYDMLKAGFLSATSVGFRPAEYVQAKDRSRGYDFTKQELLEFSIVPVPANPEALIQRGVDTKQADEWKTFIRKEWAEPKPTAWQLKQAAFDLRFTGKPEWAGEAKDAFLADVQIESEDGVKAVGEARIQKLLKINGLAALAEPDVAPKSMHEAQLVELPEPMTLELAEDLYDLDDKVLARTMAETIRATLSELAHESALRAINRARGRVS